MTTAILLAAYNGAAFLPQQLASLAAQTERGWRLVWRDDGSTDASAALLREFGGTEVTDPPPGAGVLRGFLGLLAAAPEDAARFAFCDQDDVWLPDKLARATAALEAVPDGVPALACARQRLVDAALRPIGLSPLPRRPPGFGNALVQNIATGCTLMLNAAARRAVLAAPAPDGTLHDWWCYLVVTGIGGRVIFEPEPVLLYRQHAANAVGAAAASGTRARRALQRGPGPFLARLAAHLRALAALPGLTPQAAVAVEALGALRHAGPIGRLRALRCAGVYRQGGLEDALLRLWVAARPLP